MSTASENMPSALGQEEVATVVATVVADSTVEEQLQTISNNHPAVIEFRKRESVRECRTIFTFQPEHIDNSLTCTTLSGPGMISADPYVFTDDTSGAILVFYYLGERLAGHAGIVHGGIPAVLLDEVMGRACFPRLAGKIGVTAKLELEYKSPISVGSIILARADTREVQGRKAWVDAVVEDAVDGRLHVKANALFIEPKWSADMPKVI
jgi:acyl-coenzyme A thioesterase PaaI-like protein